MKKHKIIYTYLLLRLVDVPDVGSFDGRVLLFLFPFLSSPFNLNRNSSLIWN